MKPIQMCLVAVLAISAVPTVLGSDETDPATWVPADALLYLGIADTDKLWADFKKTAAWEMINEAKAGEAAGSMALINKWVERFRQRLAEALELEQEQLENPFGGPFAFYATAPPGASGEDITPGLVAAVGDAELMNKYFTVAIRKLREVADDYESVSAGAHTIHVLTTEEGADEEGEQDDFGDFDEGGMPMGEDALANLIDQQLDKFFSAETMPEKLALCLTDDRLIVADSPEQVKSVLRRERSGESFADSEAHKALVRQFQPLGTLRVAVNVPRIIEMAAADDEEAKKWIGILGVKSVRGLIGHVHLGSDAYDYKSELKLLLSGKRTGLVKILSMENREVVPPKSLSADAVVYASINVNFLEVLDEIEKMIRQNDPEAADEMRANLEALPAGPEQTINLRKDFLEHLREPLAFGLTFTRPYGVDSTRALLSLGHGNREAMAKVLGMFQDWLTPREVEGIQVFDGVLFFAGFSVAPTSDTLYLGTSTAIESALRSHPDDALADSAAFRKIAALAAREAWGTIYFDARRFTEAAIGFMENRESMQAAAGMSAGAGIAMMLGQNIENEFGTDDPEKARALLKYFAPSIATLATEPDGIRYVEIHLKPEKD